MVDTETGPDGPFIPSCMNCAHLTGEGCEAFGGPVPFPIASGQVDHRQPFPGDNGMQWEPDAAHAMVEA